MHGFELLLVLLFAVGLVATLARKLGLPYPILMVLGGLALSLVPWLPGFVLEPQIVLLVFLPPILFAAAFFTSVRDFWRSIRPITLLAFGLVLVTTAAVAAVAQALVPGIGWAAAFALGAIVSPPDAIAATSIAQRLGLPRRLVTIIEGESLVNDATALVAYRFAVVAAVTGGFSVGQAALSFAWVVLLGLVIGIVVGGLVILLLRWLSDPPVEVSITLLAPFAAYIPAEALGGSGVLATVTAGLLLGWWAPRIMASDTRVLGSGAWQMVLFTVNGLAFLLIGLQLPDVLELVSARPAGELATVALAVAVTVVAVRLLWVFPATYLPRIVVPGLRQRDPSPPPGAVLVLGWSGMRGAVSLAAALALPTVTDIGRPFPERDLIVFLAFVVIIVTLVGQGLTLPWVIRRAGIAGDESLAHEHAHARLAAVEAALARLEELRSEFPDHLPLIDQLRDRYTHRAEHYAHDEEDEAIGMDAEAVDHARIRQAVIDAQRLKVVELRDRGLVPDDVMRRIERDLDLEELQADA